VVFGTEKYGLTNEELDLCQILMTIPGNPDYFSLNVASAIQVFAYQNYVYNTTTQFEQSSNEIASLNDLFQYLKQKSPIVSGFFLWVLFISQMA
jgi:tRNA C32,U32 (ribose-2'-O)-methylase TrmJ